MCRRWFKVWERDAHECRNSHRAAGLRRCASDLRAVLTAAPAPPPAVSEDERVERAARAVWRMWVGSPWKKADPVNRKLAIQVARAVIESYEEGESAG